MQPTKSTIIIYTQHFLILRFVTCSPVAHCTMLCLRPLFVGSFPPLLPAHSPDLRALFFSAREDLRVILFSVPFLRALPCVLVKKTCLLVVVLY
jgi:hypothetical protein